MKRIINSANSLLNEAFEICDVDEQVEVTGDTVKEWEEVKGNSKYKILSQRLETLLFGIRQLFT